MRAIRKRYFARSEPASADQPFSKAPRAASTAASHLLLGRLADLGERLLAGGVDRRVGLLRLEPLAADEEAVALAQLDDLARLGRGRVGPLGRNRRAILLSLELGHSSG